MVLVVFSSSPKKPKLITIQSFHHCSSLVSIKFPSLWNLKYYLWREACIVPWTPYY